MAVKNLLQIFLVGGLLLLFSGCLPKQDTVKSAFQTNSASSIKKDYKEVSEFILTFKEKLDLRNPDSYSKKRADKINSMIKNLDKNYAIQFNEIVLEDYKDYLQIAFSKDAIANRNDYLVLGLYYLVYELYELEDGHKLSAFSYDEKKLQKLYKNIQILNWKLKTARDLEENYLFLSWQNNWQVELEQIERKKGSINIEDIKNLKYIKNKKESLYSPSNFSFEILLTKMSDKVAQSIKATGSEPENLSISAIKSIFLFL